MTKQQQRQENTTILVIEDGDEYLDVLTRFLPEYQYAQVHCGRDAIEYLRGHQVNAIFLDMRFDRIERTRLLGDFEHFLQANANDESRTWRFLEKNQGLFILHALYEENFSDIPVILSHDFSGQPARQAHLKRTYPSLTWVPDALSPDAIRTTLNSVLNG